MPQTHLQSSPGCPTLPRGSPGQSGTGSGTAGSHALDKRSSLVSGRSAAVARSGTGASHIAEKVDHVNKITTTSRRIGQSLQSYLHTSNILFSASR